MEVISEEPLIIIDGGHNEGCAKALAECIKVYLKERRIIAICGMMADKDYDAYLKIVAPFFTSLIATRPSNIRSLDAQKLADTANKYCENTMTVENSSGAYIEAKKIAKTNDVIIICGSFFLAGELRSTLIRG
jgi:dihydrofolate synthase/folylpolyglutamate synthase